MRDNHCLTDKNGNEIDLWEEIHPYRSDCRSSLSHWYCSQHSNETIYPGPWQLLLDPIMIHYNWQLYMSLLLLFCRLVPAPFFFFKKWPLSKTYQNILRTRGTWWSCIVHGWPVTVPKKGRCFFQGKNINQYVVTVPPTFEQLSSGPPRCGILLAFSQLRFLEKTKWRGIWWHHPGVMKYHQPKQCIIIRVFFFRKLP